MDKLTTTEFSVSNLYDAVLFAHLYFAHLICVVCMRCCTFRCGNANFARRDKCNRCGSGKLSLYSSLVFAVALFLLVSTCMNVLDTDWAGFVFVGCGVSRYTWLDEILKSMA